MQNDRKVFVTDTNWRTAYYTCRALARNRIKVIGVKSIDSVYDESRYYSDILTVSPEDGLSKKMIKRVEKVAAKGDLLIPISTNTIKLIAQNRSYIDSKLIVPPISTNQLKLAADKYESIQFMQKIGINIPLTYLPESEADAEKIISRIGFPAVIKIREEGNISPQYRYGIAYNKDQSKKIYRQLSSVQQYPLVQKYISGIGMGVSILCDNGKVLAIFSHQRLREQMVTGGPSTYCSSIDSQDLEDIANCFALNSRWNGIAMLEFKYNPVENAYYFMEINPRFWGSMILAIKCGVDFPNLYCKWATGEIDKNSVIRKSKNLKLKHIKNDINAR